MKNNVFNSLSDDPLPILPVFALIACLFSVITAIYPVQAQEISGFCSNKDEITTKYTDYLMITNRKESEKIAKTSEINGKKVVAISEKVKEIGLNKVNKQEAVTKKEVFPLKQEEPSVETVAIEDTAVKPDKVVFTVITSYTSTPGQTDDTPFIAASGKHVYDGMIAANWLPFGTKIKIPELYGDKIFTVDDRMNKRYGYGRMDIWLDTTVAEARKFGVKRVNIEIYYEKPEVKTLAAAK